MNDPNCLICNFGDAPPPDEAFSASIVLFVAGFVEGRMRLRARLCDAHEAIVTALLKEQRGIPFRTPDPETESEAVEAARAAYAAKIAGFAKQRREAEAVERVRQEQLMTATLLAQGRGRREIETPRAVPAQTPEAIGQHYAKLKGAVVEVITDRHTKLTNANEADEAARDEDEKSE